MSIPDPPELSGHDLPPGDARDPRTADWLAVDPLDEVTRARLVGAAMAGSEEAVAEPAAAVAAPSSRRGPTRVLAVAAALAATLAVGLAVLVPRGDESTPTAADVPASKVAPEAGRAPASDSSGALAQSQVAPTSLSPHGDLGDVSTGALLRAGARSLRDPLFAAPTFIPRACAFEAARSLGTPVAAGTGTVDGKPATVILVERPDGRGGAVAVVDGSCALGPSVKFR